MTKGKIEVFAGAGNAGEPPAQSVTLILAAVGRTWPRYVPAGFAHPVSVTVPMLLAGPSTLSWLPAGPDTLALNDCAVIVPPFGAPPVVSPAASMYAAVPLPKATWPEASTTTFPPVPPLLPVEALACIARPVVVTVLPVEMTVTFPPCPFRKVWLACTAKAGLVSPLPTPGTGVAVPTMVMAPFARRSIQLLP